MVIVQLESGLVVVENNGSLEIYEDGYAPSMEMSCIYVWEGKSLKEFNNKEELQDAIEDLDIFGYGKE
jgi:hypothetical protein